MQIHIFVRTYIPQTYTRIDIKYTSHIHTWLCISLWYIHTSVRTNIHTHIHTLLGTGHQWYEFKRENWSKWFSLYVSILKQKGTTESINRVDQSRTTYTRNTSIQRGVHSPIFSTNLPDRVRGDMYVVLLYKQRVKGIIVEEQITFIF